MSFKKTKVVMLPTNEKANNCPILYFPKTGRLNKRAYSDEELQAGKGLIKLEYTTNHLYFLSDEEIKEGDWCVNLAHKLVVKPTDIEWANSNKDNLKKIIATTDRLEIPYQFDKWSIIPQPSEGFIQKFVESYNRGNPITEADVEYNEGQCHKTICDDNCSYPNCFEQGELKINPKDNSITIKKVKDSWTRDEVISLLQQFNNDKSGVFDCTKWIEENL